MNSFYFLTLFTQLNMSIQETSKSKIVTSVDASDWITGNIHSKPLTLKQCWTSICKFHQNQQRARHDELPILEFKNIEYTLDDKRHAHCLADDDVTTAGNTAKIRHGEEYKTERSAIVNRLILWTVSTIVIETHAAQQR